MVRRITKMIMQLDKYNELNEDLPLGLNVKIKKPGETNRNFEPEDYYYLKNFENKTGSIMEKKKSRSGIYSYRVDFDENVFGYFYSEDFEVLHKM